MTTISTEGVITVHGDGVGGLAAARKTELPRNARDKWRALERAESKRNAAHSENYDRQRLLAEKQSDLRSKVDHAENERAAGWVTYGKADLAELAEWRAEILELQIEVDSLVEERKGLPGGISISTIREWLVHEPPGRIYRPRIPVATVRKGQAALGALIDSESIRVEAEIGTMEASAGPLNIPTGNTRTYQMASHWPCGRMLTRSRRTR